MLGNSSWIMHRGRTWVGARPSHRASRASAGTGSRPATLDDVSLVVCFLALVGVLVLGGVLTLFSWVTATHPTTSTIACEPDGCVLTVPDDIQPVWPDDRRIDAPNRMQ